MPIPLLGIAARGILGGAKAVGSQQAAAPTLKVALAQGGRGIRRASIRITRDTETAALRATNRAGRWGRTRVRRELAKLLNVPQKSLRDHERRASNRKRPTYVYTIFRRQYGLHELRGVRFRPYVGQRRGGAAMVGKLRFRAYGKQQAFERVMRRHTRRGVQYLLLPPEGSNNAPKRVMGTWVKEGYRGPAAVQKQIPRVWRKEFRRQRKLLAKKRRR